jgi:hypothetical protein
MKQIPSDELIGLERHGLLFVVVCVVPPSEGYRVVLKSKYPVVADSDPVGISAKILQDPLGPIEGRLAVDHPLLIVELFPEPLEDMRFSQVNNTAWEDKLPCFKGAFDMSKELSAKQCRHDPDRDEEPFTARHPAITVQRQPSSGNNTVNMGMIHEVLSPGMNYSHETDPCPKMLRIA